MVAASVTFSFGHPLGVSTNKFLPARCFFTHVGKSSAELLKGVFEILQL